MTTPASPAFDFDTWVTLAREDPQAFEIQRHLIIDNAIAQAPARQQQRLRCLQWKLDRVRSTSRTPLQASLRINRLLWESVTGPQGLLNRLKSLQTDASAPHAGHTATILPFPGNDATGLLHGDE